MATNLTRRLTLPAYAKVNLCLSVKYPPTDGYHAVDSVLQTIDLHDTLEFVAGDSALAQEVANTRMGTPVALNCDVAGLCIHDNLIFKALDGIEQACDLPAVYPGQTLSVLVDKRIPAGGGLGGGSSDAAAALKAYARLNNLNPLGDKMLEVARTLGADVAFFLYGGAALMQGRGDVLQRCLPSFPLPLVLMGDAQGNPTGSVYAAFDENPVKAPDAYALARLMEREDVKAQELASLCRNNLEPAACRVGERLDMRMERAKADPAVLNALVAGSGATSFAICATEEDARQFASRACEYCDWACVAHAAEG